MNEPLPRPWHRGSCKGVLDSSFATPIDPHPSRCPERQESWPICHRDLLCLRRAPSHVPAESLTPRGLGSSPLPSWLAPPVAVVTASAEAAGPRHNLPEELVVCQGSRHPGAGVIHSNWGGPCVEGVGGCREHLEQTGLNLASQGSRANPQLPDLLNPALWGQSRALAF